jgi:hypothetical protein
MKFLRALLCVLPLVLTAGAARGATTINATNRLAYGANLGWVDWRGDTTNGAIIGAYVCSGSLWSANVGWITLGGGAPADGVRYQNNSATDFGVNHDGLGQLSGLAWAANLGWLAFTNRASDGSVYEGPRVDLLTGRLSGLVWSANAGWLSLSNQFAHVQTDTLDCGPDTDHDGLPDAWEIQVATNLTTLTGGGDNDGDGVGNLAEFSADTNPLDAASRLRVTSATKTNSLADTVLSWTTSPARLYRVRVSTNVAAALPWPDAGWGLFLPDPGATTTRTFPAVADPASFFIIEARKPLSP